jgi:hypothetical protein
MLQPGGGAVWDLQHAVQHCSLVHFLCLLQFLMIGTQAALYVW